MLQRAVPSGPVTACLVQDLAHTSSHQSYLKLSPLQPLHPNTARGPDLCLLPAVCKLLTLASSPHLTLQNSKPKALP